MAGIDFAWPTYAKVATVTVRKPEAQIERAADGKIRLRELLVPEPEGGARSERQARERGQAREGRQAGAEGGCGGPAGDPGQGGAVGFPLEVGAFVLEDGYIRFLDRAVKPAFSETISRLAVRVENLSSTPGTRAKLKSQAIVGGDAALDINGELAPLGPALRRHPRRAARLHPGQREPLRRQRRWPGSSTGQAGRQVPRQDREQPDRRHRRDRGREHPRGALARGRRGEEAGRPAAGPHRGAHHRRRQQPQDQPADVRAARQLQGEPQRRHLDRGQERRRQHRGRAVPGDRPALQGQATTRSSRWPSSRSPSSPAPTRSPTAWTSTSPRWPTSCGARPPSGSRWRRSRGPADVESLKGQELNARAAGAPAREEAEGLPGRGRRRVPRELPRRETAPGARRAADAIYGRPKTLPPERLTDLLARRVAAVRDGLVQGRGHPRDAPERDARPRNDPPPAAGEAIARGVPHRAVDVGGPEMAPHTPQRSGRPGKAVAPFCCALRAPRHGVALFCYALGASDRP